MHKSLVAIAFALLTGMSLAATPSTESVEKLLGVSKASQLMDATIVQLEEEFRTGMKAAAGTDATKPEQSQMIDTLTARFMGLAKEKLVWDKVKPQFVQIYQSTLSQAEVDSLVAFYSTPVGQTLVDKMPILSQKASQFTQTLVAEIMPQVMASIQNDIQKITPKQK